MKELAVRYNRLVKPSRSTSDVVRPPSRSSLNRTGAAVVEFAVILPLLLMLVLGMVEIGRAIMVQQTLVDTARAATRKAVLTGTTEQHVLDIIDISMKSAGMSVYTVSFEPDPPADAGAGEPVTVTISVSFGTVSWLPLQFLKGDDVLQGVSIMPRE